VSRAGLLGSEYSTFCRWKSVVENLEAIEGVQGWSETDKNGVRGGNALDLFSLA
jgi:aminocarboxymuconate-semialdehyde decarboxylase